MIINSFIIQIQIVNVVDLKVSAAVDDITKYYFSLWH